MKLANMDERLADVRAQEIVKKMNKGEMSKGAAIREMFAGGWSVKEISAFTQIRYNHVYNVCKNEVLVHGLEVEASERESGNTKKARILALLAEGKSITEVSKELQCLYNQVWQVAKDNGYTPKQKALASKGE